MKDSLLRCDVLIFDLKKPSLTRDDLPKLEIPTLTTAVTREALDRPVSLEPVL
jgi:hypothetical protein